LEVVGFACVLRGVELYELESSGLIVKPLIVMRVDSRLPVPGCS
jgi:hypothetical protein